MKICLDSFPRFTPILLFSLLAFAGEGAAQEAPSEQLNRTLELQRRTVAIHNPSQMTNSGSGYRVLYSFCLLSNCADGEGPEAGLLQDPAGNLYGTTLTGGAHNSSGTVFKLAPPAKSGGLWTETVIYNFCAVTDCFDGEAPSSQLIRDAAGNLYGTTRAGGDFASGLVFRLTPPNPPGGLWIETPLYSFCSLTSCTDGDEPLAGLTQDATSNLYGTTRTGGTNNFGTAFKLAPPAQPDLPWTESVIFNFCLCPDGDFPTAVMMLDAAGNLYGTTTGGGAQGAGAVFKLTPATQPGALWTETLLYSFCTVPNCSDGDMPQAGLIQDAAGNLYGTTGDGGANNSNNDGIVFKLTPPPHPGGAWTETVLYSFCALPSCADGQFVLAGVIQDVAGNLYGTTQQGGASNDGTVFKLAPPAHPGGAWTETVLHNFCSSNGCADGESPLAGLNQDAAGNLYGTTSMGGAKGDGAVFELVGGVHKANTALGSQVDYFGEGRSDFTVWRPSDATFYSIDPAGKRLTRAWGASTDIPVVGDFDGDGKTDIAVWRPSTGVWYIIQSRTGQTLEKTFGAPTDKPVPGDYDGDGKTDIAVWRPSTGVWFIIQSSNGQIVEKTWGDPDDKPVPGDYDGDGKTDVAVWRPSTGVWFIIQSSNSQIVEKTWGVPTDKPVPGDYDGDGKTDITVWRPSTGVWYIIRSSNGETTEQTLGTTGDIPVSRDYDGDGRTDVAVWRPSKGTWYVNETSTGRLLEKAWGLSTDIPMNKPIGQ